MEECETLCDRLTILVKGDMKFIGSAEDLKNKYAYGFSLMIKLRTVPNEKEEVRKDKIELLKVVITTKFRADACFLKEETQVCYNWNCDFILLMFFIGNNCILPHIFRHLCITISSNH